MKAADVRLAVTQLHEDPGTPLERDDLDGALERVLPLLRVLVADIPWWRKLVRGIGALVDAVQAYLEERDR